MKVKIVAEIGINANGSIDIAKKLIDNAKYCGCDYVKFQKRDINIVYSKEELEKPRQNQYDETISTRDQKEKLEFNEEQYYELDWHCKKRDIGWFASPWDVNSVIFLSKFKPSYIKVASALITNIPVLEEIKKTKIPAIISTGMSNKEEVDKCINTLGLQIKYILVCNSTYPCQDGKNKLFLINLFKELYGDKYKIGFSSHSPGILFSTCAVSMGSEMIECHITLDRSSWGSDQASSLEKSGLERMCSYIRAIESESLVNDWIVFPEEEIIKKKLRKV